MLCETYQADGQPAVCNNRTPVDEFVEKCHADHDLGFGFEMEYFLMDPQTNKPLGWPADPLARPLPQGHYYCGTGANAAYAQTVNDDHFDACIKAGLTIAGTNGDVVPGQWEIQIGIVYGLDAADQLWIARYLLQRAAERHGLSLAPKLDSEYNGSGLHTNVSSDDTRGEGGLEFIKNTMDNFAKLHASHMAMYGDGDASGMTGECETASFDKFSYGVTDRGASVRIPRTIAADGRGYFEDMHPASSADPYLVIKCIGEAMYA